MKNGKGAFQMNKVEIYEAEDVIKLEEDGVIEEVVVESYDLVVGEELIATIYDYKNAQKIAEMLNSNNVEIMLTDGEPNI